MGEHSCCGVVAQEKFYAVKRRGGGEWQPMYLEYVDEERCVGCGMCVRVCLGQCYEMQNRNGKVVSVAVNPENCIGDCHCHMVCPTEAMVCQKKPLEV